MLTKICRVDEKRIDSRVIEEAAAFIQRGELVAFPTETVYGLGANGLDERACAEIYRAKGRPSDNPLILHVAEPRDIVQYAYEDEKGLLWRLANEFMPGPLTVVLKKRSVVPSATTGGLDTVAIRCPANPVARELIRMSGVPIAAPSANRSGSPSPTKAEHVIHDLDGRISMILHGQRAAIGVESTIVSLCDDGVHLLRPGFITVEDLERVCDRIQMDKAVTRKLNENERPMAPGMKYRHYAPETELVMIEGEDDKVLDFFDRSLEEGCGVLCFDEDVRHFSSGDRWKQVDSYGSRGDALKQANLLFDVLRRVDQMGVEKVYVRAPLRDGVGLAVFNRLIKACSYQLIRLE